MDGTITVREYMDSLVDEMKAFIRMVEIENQETIMDT